MNQSLHDETNDERSERVSVKRLRWCSRLVMLLATTGLLTWGIDTVWPVIVTALSPFVVAAGVLVTRTWPWYGWISLAVLAIVAWRQRWFCRWACPMGFCADQATWLGRRCGRERGRWPAVGQWIALLTLMGAAVGYPLLLWLDPLALLSAAITSVAPAAAAASLWMISGLVAVLLVSLVWPNLWCSKLCPLGGTQDIVFALANSTRGVLLRRGGQQRPQRSRSPLGGIRRRTVLGAIFGVVWATATLKTRQGVATPLRPPGSVPEPRFSGLCIRCGNCSRACPTDIVFHDVAPEGLASLLTPRVSFDSNFCLESCNLCTLVCPSGAIQPVALEAKMQTRMGTPAVDMDLCLLGDDRECSLCRNHCPFEAISLKFSEEFYTLTPIVNLDMCPGCGACELACPTKPEKAIVVRPE